MLLGGAGNDHLWGGEWRDDKKADTFVFESGTGKDYIHDFEIGLDLNDLSDFSTDFEAVSEVSIDLGWATIIELRHLDSGQLDDRIVLKTIELNELGSESLIF